MTVTKVDYSVLVAPSKRCGFTTIIHHPEVLVSVYVDGVRMTFDGYEIAEQIKNVVDVWAKEQVAKINKPNES